jgi:hypothetical protein
VHRSAHVSARGGRLERLRDTGERLRHRPSIPHHTQRSPPLHALSPNECGWQCSGPNPSLSHTPPLKKTPINLSRSLFCHSQKNTRLSPAVAVPVGGGRGLGRVGPRDGRPAAALGVGDDDGQVLLSFSFFVFLEREVFERWVGGGGGEWAPVVGREARS